MYIEQIRIYMDDNEYINPHPPADLKMITNAENRLNVTFPNELKELLLEMDGDNWLLLSVKQIIEDNLLVRETLSEFYEGLDELLFIGGNGCGDYYSYSIQDGQIKSTEIVRWEHEDNTKIVVAYSLKEMIDRYYNNEI
jgi:cell wall assembly regulator SMI1